MTRFIWLLVFVFVAPGKVVASPLLENSRLVAMASDDGEDEEPAPPRRRSSSSGYPRFSYDLGGSAGTVNNISYTELNLGLNTFFIEWLDWRNAVFYRIQSGTHNVYGLDTSVRGILGAGGRALGFTVFAGPGFRFINEGPNAPFAEAGAILKLAGLAIGLGAKTIFNSWVSPGYTNDSMIFIILGGGGSF